MPLEAVERRFSSHGVEVILQSLVVFAGNIGCHGPPLEVGKWVETCGSALDEMPGTGKLCWLRRQSSSAACRCGSVRNSSKFQ
jgi:hypothetical protein